MALFGSSRKISYYTYMISYQLQLVETML